MASADVDIRKYFCHECKGEVSLSLPDYTCSQCDSGFIEEVENNDSATPGEGEDEFHEDLDDPIFGAMSMLQPLGRTRRRMPAGAIRIRRTTGTGGTGQGSSLMLHFGGSHGTPAGVQMTGSNTALDTFIQQLFTNLGVQVLNAQMGPGGNTNGTFGDYAWGPNGLDDIITQLLNQLDNTGPPPADKTKIDSLPIDKITQKDVDDNVDCAVCQEKYKLDEEVKRLPCLHVYHPECVDPWLEMHDSCPVCRCNLNGEQPAETKS